jgi:LCP family protein required for cell wall assembly
VQSWVYALAQKRYSFKNWFMQRKQISTDGFVVRRRGQQPIGVRPAEDTARSQVPSQFLLDPARKLVRPTSDKTPVLERAKVGGVNPLSANGNMALPTPNQRIDIDLSLDDDNQGGGGKRGKGGKKGRGQRGPKKWPMRRIVKWSSIVLSVLVLAFVGYFAYKILSTGGKIFKGNPIAAIFSQGKPLQQDANGQTNVVLFGTSEDDPGHPGGDLTDSIMVVSINQTRKDGYLVSIPRDLHVQYDAACVSGYQGKINVVYSCAKDANNGSEDAGAAALRKKVGEVLGLDIQYSVHVNYTALRQAVDAVGGITVTIQSDDPRGILDRNFDWDCPKGPNTCYNVKYPNGPVALNGKQALYLARARGDDPLGRTYGLSRSNPDREDNQRKILIALKDKAVSAGVLTNPVAVNNLLDALGNNLRTTFDAQEIKTIVDLGKNIKTQDLMSFSLENADHPLATAICYSGDICPNAGNTNFSAIQTAMHNLAIGNKAALEYAKVDVLNGTGTAGVAQTEADALTAQGLTVGLVGNAPISLAPKHFQFYDLSNGTKPETLKKLQSLLGVSATSGTPTGVSSSADFVVIVGADTSATSQSSQSNQ